MDTILIVDDSVMQARVLQQILESNYQVELCSDSLSVPEVAKRMRPDLILLDVVMPKIDGFEVLAQLKRNLDLQDIPVILITSLSSAGYEEKGLLLGAVDYIIKPFNPSVVRARVRTHTQLYAYRRAIEKLVRIDGLTGIPNRRYYDERSQEEWSRGQRQQEPLSIGMLDIDFFKQYNDTYGHLKGDEALHAVAQSVASTLQRSSDFVARFGGEEFAFLLPNTPVEGGKKVGW